MRNTPKRYLVSAVLLCISLALVFLPTDSAAKIDSNKSYILGFIHDLQEQPVSGAEVTLFEDEHLIASALTQKDGRYALEVPDLTLVSPSLSIGRTHFETIILDLTDPQLEQISAGKTVVIKTVTLLRQISIAFWISAFIFVVVLILIATGTTHNTLAALMGASLLLGISYLDHPISEELFIVNFDVSISYIDWNVIFLIMGMMMFIAIGELTGIFHWMAFFAYKSSRGRMLVLLPILMLITGCAEAAGYKISYGYFLRKGLPALLITVSLALTWLLIKFL